MRTSLQRQWLTDILEAVPSIAFLALWRNGLGMEAAGWVGAALAASLLGGFQLLKVRSNPIMLGINVHLVVITPLIVGISRLGAPELAGVLAASSYEGVFVTVFCVGCALTLLGKDGFIGVAGLAAKDRRKLSLLLLAGSAAATAWAFWFDGSALLKVAAPMLAIFAIRRFLVARTIDRSNRSAGLLVVGTAPLAAGFDPDL